ncbi:hypothetical protein JCM8202v2_002443 [Rhodotorula sphaerocarpa]
MERAGASGATERECPPPQRPTANSAAEPSHRSAAPANVAPEHPSATNTVVSPSTLARQSFRYSAPATLSAKGFGSVSVGATRPLSTSKPSPFSFQQIVKSSGGSAGPQSPSGLESILSGQGQSSNNDEEAPPADLEPVISSRPSSGKADATLANSSAEVGEVPLRQRPDSTSLTWRRTSAPASTTPTEREAASSTARESRHASESQRRGPKPFRPAASTVTAPERASPQPAFDNFTKPSDRLPDSRKRSVENEATEEHAQPKRAKGAEAEVAEEGVRQQVSPRGTPKIDAVDSDTSYRASTTRRNTSTGPARSAGSDRAKRPARSESRTEARSRPATSRASLAEDLVAGVRRWQRHEIEAKEEERRLRAQLAAKQSELAAAVESKDQLKGELNTRVNAAVASARDAEATYNARTTELQTLLGVYKAELSSSLAELRAEVTQTKSALEPGAESLQAQLAALEETKLNVVRNLRDENQKWRVTVEELRQELGDAVGRLTEAQDRLDTETARATKSHERADAYAEQLDKLRTGASEESGKFNARIRQLRAREDELLIAHAEQLELKEAAHRKALADFHERAEADNQQTRSSIEALEAKITELKGEIAKLVDESAEAARANAKAAGELEAALRSKEDDIKDLTRQLEEAQRYAAQSKEEARIASQNLSELKHERDVQDLEDHFGKERAAFADELKELEAYRQQVASLRDRVETVEADREAAVLASEAAVARAEEAEMRAEQAYTQSSSDRAAADESGRLLRQSTEGMEALRTEAKALEAEKISLHQQLDTAQSLLESVHTTPDAKSREEVSKLRREVEELTTTTADALAGQQRAIAARDDIASQVVERNQKNRQLEAERAASEARVSTLEAQVEDLKAAAAQRQKSEGGAQAAIELEQAIKAKEAAFEQEKQDAVRKAIESFTERSKLDMMNSQNEIKRMRNQITELERKLRKAQTEITQSSARAGRGRPALFMGTPVSADSNSTDEQATPSKAGQAATAGFAEVAHDESPDHLPVENGEDDRETQTYAKKTVRFAGNISPKKRTGSVTRTYKGQGKKVVVSAGTENVAPQRRNSVTAAAPDVEASGSGSTPDSQGSEECGPPKKALLSRLEEELENEGGSGPLEDVDDPIQTFFSQSTAPSVPARPPTVSPAQKTVVGTRLAG